MAKTVPLKNCIRAWESSFFHDKFLMGPSTQVIVESTIGYLKELEDLKPRVGYQDNDPDAQLEMPEP